MALLLMHFLKRYISDEDVLFSTNQNIHDVGLMAAVIPFMNQSEIAFLIVSSSVLKTHGLVR